MVILQNDTYMYIKDSKIISVHLNYKTIIFTIDQIIEYNRKEYINAEGYTRNVPEKEYRLITIDNDSVSKAEELIQELLLQLK